MTRHQKATSQEPRWSDEGWVATCRCGWATEPVAIGGGGSQIALVDLGNHVWRANREAKEARATHLREHDVEYADGCPICEDEETVATMPGTRTAALALARLEGEGVR